VSGATTFLTHAEEIRELVAKPTKAVAILPTVVDHRYGLTETVMGMIAKVCERHNIPMLTGIRTDASVGKAMRARQFLADLDPKSKALEDYKAVTAKIVELLEGEEKEIHGEPAANVA
jgi:chromosome partitioning protein